MSFRKNKIAKNGVVLANNASFDGDIYGTLNLSSLFTRYASSPALYFVGKMAEIKAYGYEMTDTQEATEASNLMTKYGIA